MWIVVASPTDVIILGIVQTNSLDSGNVCDSVADVNVDDSPDSEIEQIGTAEETIKLPHCVSLTSWNSWRESRKWIAVNHKVRRNICSEVLGQGLGTLKALAGPRACSKSNFGFAQGVTTDRIKKSRSDKKK
jgi:hypothetical protein